jgi:hypothetical protein
MSIRALNSAKLNKAKLLEFDKQLSSTQTNIFILKAKREESGVLMMKQMEQSIKNNRQLTINAIATDVNMAIINAINAIKISIQQHNFTTIILDDYMLQNIANFVNEYYKSNELQLAIKNICNSTMIKYEIATLIINYKQRFLPGLINLNSVLS